MAKIKLDTMAKNNKADQTIRIKVTSEVVVRANYLTGTQAKYDTIEDLVQAVDQRLGAGRLHLNWSEVISDCEIWAEENWTDLDIEWA